VADGWLPPQAPGGRPPPRFDMVVPERGPARAAQPVPQPVAAQPYARARTPAAPRTNGLALTALIVGLLGIALLVITLGLGFVFSLPCSIAAWVCGAQARTRINLGEATSGRGQANAGYLLGVAGVVIGVAAAVGWIVWIANGGDFEQLQHDIQRYRDSHAREAAIHAVRALLGR
jgi:hypothetical protein